jgi:Protein of unknown function (DUF2501)
MRLAATGISTAVFLTFAAIGATSGQAQLLNTLKDAAGGTGTGSSSGAMGNLGGLALPSVGSASSSNVAGVLKFCVQNQLTGGGDASSVQSSLVDKLGGAKNEQAAPAYQSGSKGVLEASGKSVDVSQLNTQVKSKVCDQVLQRAKSLL